MRERNWEGKGMLAGSLLFFKVTFQKGRRREGVEGIWHVNQGITADENGTNSHGD